MGSSHSRLPRFRARFAIVTVTLAVIELLLPGVAMANPGDLDPGFGGDGLVTTDFGSYDASVSALVVQPDGKLVAAGITVVPEGFTFDFALVRYNRDGSPDSSFGDNGRVTTDLGGVDEARAVAVQPDGMVVVAGAVGDGQGYADFALARYTPDGEAPWV